MTDMPYQLAVQADPPIIRVTLLPDYRARDHQDDVLRRILDAVLQSSHPVSVLLDIRQARIAWSDQVLSLAGLSRYDLSGPHPNYRDALIITTNKVLKFGLQAWADRMYGTRIAIFDTPDLALQHIRSREVVLESGA